MILVLVCNFIIYSRKTGNNDISINTLLQQLLLTTTSLKASLDNIDVKMNEMKNQQTDIQANINHIEKVVLTLQKCRKFNKTMEE